MKIIETIKGKKVGTDGYELEEFEKPDGGDVQEKVKTKILWTGPLATVGVPTNLNAGEKFSDWDYVIVLFNTSSDSGVFDLQTICAFRDITVDWRSYKDDGYLHYRFLSDTSFQLQDKTTSVGNISNIIGIKL